MPIAAASRRPTTRARDRTQRLLIDAAVRIFARKGTGAAAIHEVAAEAGVSNGTFYNYFRTREELVAAASLSLAERLFDEITASARGVTDPAERVAIGARRFIMKAKEERIWGAALLRVWASSPVLAGSMAAPLRDDLRLGKRRRRLRYTSEAAAVGSGPGHRAGGDAHRARAPRSQRGAREHDRGDAAARPRHRRRGGRRDRAQAVAAYRRRRLRRPFFQRGSAARGLPTLGLVASGLTTATP